MNDPHNSRPRAAILAVGTEITTGQIINSNAALLSQRLTDMGLEVFFHCVVPDDRPLIKLALNNLRAIGSDLVIVTGGLGPTSDDFTREVICQWYGDQLVFDRDSWSQIVSRLESFGIAVAESNRQQCFFPGKAKILVNNAGTANGFWLERESYPRLVCLPGPPREINAIWRDSLAALIGSKFNLPEPDRLFRWHCIGKSESALGEIIESIVAGSQLRTGYRPHVPYVEIKVWCSANYLEESASILKQIDDALKPWSVAKDDTDLAEDFWHHTLSYKKVFLKDSASDGRFARRLLEVRSRLSSMSLPDFQCHIGDNHNLINTPSDDTLGIQLCPAEVGNSWRIELFRKRAVTQHDVQVSYRPSPENQDRFNSMLVELVLFRINSELQG